MDDVYCYAQRLLNPFRGMLHTVAYASAEAVSTDGVHWDIYVRNDQLVGDLENSSNVQQQEKSQEEVMSTFSIELHPSPAE
jgi:hypothetical protein